jgi:hypothetical protein
MARVIEYYVPNRYTKPVKWTPQVQRGKVIEFCLPSKRSARSKANGTWFGLLL